MRKPELRVENNLEVYDYYRKNPGSKTVLNAAMILSRAFYHPRITYSAGAKEAIDELSARRVQFLFASNHQIFWDQFALAGAVHRDPAFRDVRGNAFVPAKVGHYSRFKRPILDALGAIPTFRSSDVDDEQKFLRRRATSGLVDVCVDRMVQGKHGLVFPEGTRIDSQNSRELGKILPGILRIASLAEEWGVDVAVQPLGMWFGGDGKEHTFRPEFHYGHPITGPHSADGVAVNGLREAMAHCKAQAIANYEAR